MGKRRRTAVSVDTDLILCYNTNKEGNDRRSLPEFWLKITAFSLQLSGGYFFLLIKKEMILNIITVNPVRKIPI